MLPWWTSIGQEASFSYRWLKKSACWQCWAYKLRCWLSNGIAKAASLLLPRLRNGSYIAGLDLSSPGLLGFAQILIFSTLVPHWSSLRLHSGSHSAGLPIRDYPPALQLHPRADQQLFALNTVLALIAGTSRKGNQPVYVEYEGDLEACTGTSGQRSFFPDFHLGGLGCLDWIQEGIRDE